MIGGQELLRRFAEPEVTPARAAYCDTLRFGFAKLAGEIDEIAPDSREKSLAITALEESMYWAFKSILTIEKT